MAEASLTAGQGQVVESVWAKMLSIRLAAPPDGRPSFSLGPQP
jgi:hypothetical protein